MVENKEYSKVASYIYNFKVNSICCGLSQSRHRHGKKDACSLYDWIVYKQRSKAKEEERKRQAVI